MTRAALLAVPALVLPALVLSLAVVLAVARPHPDWLAAAVRGAPLVVFVGGAALGLFLRRGRLVLGLVVLAMADRALVHLGGRAVFDAVALLLPLNLGALVWLGEASLLTAPGGARLGVLLLQAGAVLLFQRPDVGALVVSLERPLVATHLGAWTALPQLALVAFVVALCLILARFLADRRPLSAGAAWALVASFLALDGASVSGLANLYFVAAGLLLVVGAAWQDPRIIGLDDVTGLPTSFALNKALLRLPRRYALARVEIDEFARFREYHGAEAARRMLRLIAEALTKVSGHGGAFYCGAYTFAVVFRRMSAELASQHLDSVRRAVEAATLDVRVPQRAPGQPGRVGSVVRTVSVTISIGVAQPPGRHADPHGVLRAADLALDRAKQAGQNRVSA